MVAPLLRGEALEEDEPFTVEQVFAEVCEERRQRRQWEVLLSSISTRSLLSITSKETLPW